MPGIAGINKRNSNAMIRNALSRLEHRGSPDNTVAFSHAVTHGQTTRGFENIVDSNVVLDGCITNWRELSPGAMTVYDAVWDAYQRMGPRFVCQLDGSFALAIATGNGHFLARDRLGMAPLYVATCQGMECFASEPKALAAWAEDIREFPPGCYCEPGEGTVPYYQPAKGETLDVSPDTAAATLRKILSQSVRKALTQQDGAGVWLSGGLDSSALAAIVSEDVDGLMTFTVGMQGCDDLEHARLVANALHANHHELVITPRDIDAVIPDVIYYLETYEPEAVRQCAMSFLAARMAADHVPAVLAGDGADELFGGYGYLKKLEPIELDPVLLDLVGDLHKAVLPRVDRSGMACGITVHLPFLDRKMVSYAFMTAPGYKVWDGETKWIIRQAMYGDLPQEVLSRPVSECWEAERVRAAMARYTGDLISDSEFERERRLCAFARLRSKEELHYYRIFLDHFGEQEAANLDRQAVAGMS